MTAKVAYIGQKTEVDVYNGVVTARSAVIQARVTVATSTTDITLGELANVYIDNYFNDWYMVVLDTTDNAAPKLTYKQITDYTGASGLCICNAFGANVDVNDIVALVPSLDTLPGCVSRWGFATTVAHSTTQFDMLTLTGYGDDYFKGALAIVQQTTDGLAPLGEKRLITAYTSAATGRCTVADAFSSDIDTGDKILIIPKTGEAVFGVSNNHSDPI